ncbi:Tn3 family transposase [bacterium]|nr:Tn3 family transposase [bacterium]
METLFVLDGMLYNESDLPLEEHYVDTHEREKGERGRL